VQQSGVILFLPSGYRGPDFKARASFVRGHLPGLRLTSRKYKIQVVEWQINSYVKVYRSTSIFSRRKAAVVMFDAADESRPPLR
jgi:hypothetical protein